MASKAGAPATSGKKQDATKGQMSIASFFSRKPVTTDPAPENSTPKPSKEIIVDVQPVAEPSQRRNLQKSFEYSPEDDKGCEVPLEVEKKSEVQTVNDVEVIDADSSKTKFSSKCIVDLTKPKAEKSAFAPRTTADTKQKTAPAPPLKGTLHFLSDAKQNAVKEPKSRTPHPDGTPFPFQSNIVMIAQFCKTFSKQLGLDEPIDIKDLHYWLESRKFSSRSPIAQLHLKLLSFIIRDGETPDEERLLDEDTWPKIMREHLEDTHGNFGQYAETVEALSTKEYCDVPKENRLEALEILVNDCLQTVTFRNLLDASVDVVDDLRREQQVEGLQDKYKKHESESLPTLNFAPVVPKDVEIELVDEENVEGMTERQKAKQKSKQEHEMKKREEEMKREIETKKKAEEDARRLEQERKHEKSVQRAMDIMEHGDQVRVKNFAYSQESDRRNYLILTCAGSRSLFMETVGETTSWAAFCTKSERDQILDHFKPRLTEGKDRREHKMVTELMSDLQEDMNKSDLENFIKESQSFAQLDISDDDFDLADVQNRTRNVVLEMEECTPEDMFHELEEYKKKRAAWTSQVSESQNPQELCDAVRSFEKQIKRCKMIDGWDDVRKKWLSDLNEVITFSVLLYLVKQLRVYLGRQKPKPGKIAPLFTGPPRLTRSQIRRTDESSEKKTKKRALDDDGVDDDVQGSEEASPAPSSRRKRITEPIVSRVTRSQANPGKAPRASKSDDPSSGTVTPEIGGSSGESCEESDSDFQCDSDERHAPALRSVRPKPLAKCKPDKRKLAAKAVDRVDGRNRQSQRKAKPTHRGSSPPRRSTRGAAKGSTTMYAFDSDSSDSD